MEHKLQYKDLANRVWSKISARSQSWNVEPEFWWSMNERFLWEYSIQNRLIRKLKFEIVHGT